MGCGGLRGVGGNNQLLEDEKRGGTYAALDIEEIPATTTLACSVKWRISAQICSFVKPLYQGFTSPSPPPQNSTLASTGTVNHYIRLGGFANSNFGLVRNRVGMVSGVTLIQSLFTGLRPTGSRLPLQLRFADD